MDEAKKTSAIRGPEFIERYLKGRVIDIGAGPDLVCAWAERFDIEDGDANVITRYRESAAYDAVHSSHCLEHMHDPESALAEWWALLKPGGYMVTVVPHEDLYEQGMWPSNFNWDHKSTFRLGGATSWSPRSFDVKQIMSNLPGSTIVSAEVHDTDYDYSLQKKIGDKVWHEHKLWRLVKFSNAMPFQRVLGRPLRKLLFELGMAIDQTLCGALAQIQIVARKQP